MFSRNRGPGRIFGRNNGPGGKKHQSRTWMLMNKLRNQPKEPKRTDFDVGVMMSADPSAALRASIPSSGYVELPDEPRSGKITPSSTSNSSPSPRGSKSEATNGGTSSLEDEAIEEAVPIVRSTLPSPEPRPIIELSHNGYKDRDMVDSNGLKAKPLQQPDVDNDSCLIKCVYFTQQCCECTIV